MHNFHVFVLMVLERVTLLKMEFFEKEYFRTSVLQNTCFIKFYFWFILTSEAVVHGCLQNSCS